MLPDQAQRYTALVGEPHRKKFGQFFTDQRIAKFMVEWVTQGDAKTLYDPAFGLGVFHRVARSQGFEGRFTGSEIDRQILSFALGADEQQHVAIECRDYLTQWDSQQQAIICNPPYMRFQHFQGRAGVFTSFESRLSIKLSGYTNIASAFLIKSLHELIDGGRLAYIMPLEFLNAGYGKLVKKLLLEMGSLQAVIKIDCEKEAFPDVTTSVGIILFHKSTLQTPVRFYCWSDINNLQRLHHTQPISSVHPSKLLPDEKWLKYFETSPQAINSSMLVPVSAYGLFNRGIATGANEYFALTAEKITLLGLRQDEVTSCITKSAQIKSILFEQADMDTLHINQMPVFLLNIKGELSDAAKKYLAEGERLGFHQRYLTMTRKPWYKIEKRLPSPLLFGVFSRNGYKVIRNYTNALNLTCYHGFQPNLFGERYVDHLFLYFLSKAGKYILSQNMRKYGDALDKFEPNDLNCAHCPNIDWLEKIPRREIEKELNGLRQRGALSESMESRFAELVSPCDMVAIETRVSSEMMEAIL